MSRIATKLVFIQRSDGKEITVDSRTRREEKNAPTSEQLTKTKGENGQWSYYHELEITDKRNYDWRKKLGGLLIETMAAAMKDKKEDMSKLSEFWLLQISETKLTNGRRGQVRPCGPPRELSLVRTSSGCESRQPG